MTSTRRTILIAALWLLAFGIALSVDRPVAEWVHRQGWDAHRSWSATHRAVNFVLKVPGEYVFTLAVALAVTLVHPSRWRAGAFVALAGVVSGVNGLVKWVVGRHRPVEDGAFLRHAPFDFQPFVGGLRGLFGGEKNLCFPSGHACLAFATAAAVGLVVPRWRYWLYTLAVLVGIERVLENAHYVSDVVGAAALGILAAHLTYHVLRRLTRPPETADATKTQPTVAASSRPVTSDT